MRVYCLLLTLLPVLFAQNQEANVCKSWLGYFNKKTSKDCYYDHEVDESDAPSLIIKNGFPFENYDFKTPDGYILSLFRIPANNGIPVLLVHSSDFSSTSFLALKNNSLAYVLANNNYDIFLLNLRGSRYSENHVTLSNAESAFWDYTLDHLAQYDVPTAFRFIEKLTGSRKVLFVGHNSGASVFLAHGALFPEEINDRAIAAVLIAPVVEMEFSTKNNLITKLFSGFSNSLWKLQQYLGFDRLFSQYQYQNVFITTVRTFPFLMKAFLKQQISPELAPYYLNAIAGGGSQKLKLNIDQIIAKNSFEMYDYGEMENINKYGFKKPLKYDYSKIQSPVFIVHAKDDEYVHGRDVEKVYSKLDVKAKALLGKLMVDEDGFGRNDYLFGKDAKKLVYDVILEKFDKAVRESPGSNSEGLMEGK